MDSKSLVNNEEVPIHGEPPTYSEIINVTTPTVSVSNSATADGNMALRNSINCQVCRQFINLDQKQNNLVVKCPSCGEATPIKAAPPGKKYVRCTCNGLLICKASSSRVGCPRAHCRSIITLAPTTDEIGVVTGVTSSTGLLSQTLRVICANCGSPFIVNSRKNTTRLSAKCPHCESISSIGPGYARVRYGFLITLGIIFLIIGIIVTITTYTIAQSKGGYYVIFIGILLCGVITTIRGVLYCFMPISKIDSPMPPSNSV